tara:strand:+ start:36 stop:263 length:228 start_codon:yes stop_codon:yes gene_type:complete
MDIQVVQVVVVIEVEMVVQEQQIKETQVVMFQVVHKLIQVAVVEQVEQDKVWQPLYNMMEVLAEQVKHHQLLVHL